MRKTVPQGVRISKTMPIKRMQPKPKRLAALKSPIKMQVRVPSKTQAIKPKKITVTTPNKKRPVKDKRTAMLEIADRETAMRIRVSRDVPRN